MTEQAAVTFMQRCQTLGLWAWPCIGGELQPPAEPCDDTACAPADLLLRVEQMLDELREADQAKPIDDTYVAAWVPDPQGNADGFVLATQNTAGTDHTELAAAHLTRLAQALGWDLQDLHLIDQNQFAVDDLAEELGQSYENITLLYGIGQSMRSLQTPHRLVQSICDQLRVTQGYGWSAARFMEDDEDAAGLTDTCLVAGELPCDNFAFRDASEKLLDQWDDKNWNNLLQVGQDKLADLTQSEVILHPVRHDGQVVGVVMAGGKDGPDPEATSGDTQLMEAIAGFLGAFHENAARFTEQKNMFIGSLEAVSAALDAKDRYTFGHSERVALLGMRLAEAIGLDAQEVERIRISGLVHDVGKIGVPESVLCKTGKLNDDEFEQIKKHPRIGFNILKGIPKMADVLDGVLYHHERWDGRGYPDRLAGEAIPMYGRILAVADTFDAMSSTRSYRQAMPREKVLAEIARCSGTQFDPALTGPFLSLDFAEYDELVQHHQGISEEGKKSQAA